MLGERGVGGGGGGGGEGWIARVIEFHRFVVGIENTLHFYSYRLLSILQYFHMRILRQRTIAVVRRVESNSRHQNILPIAIVIISQVIQQITL